MADGLQSEARAASQLAFRAVSGGGAALAAAKHAATAAYRRVMAGGGTVSVVRATCAIRAGEPCLISYLQPLELSRAAQRERLRQLEARRKERRWLNPSEAELQRERE